MVTFSDRFAASRRSSRVASHSVHGRRIIGGD
jgi:hypothetical protein